jgi:ATP-binding cassette subfamily F protein 3
MASARFQAREGYRFAAKAKQILSGFGFRERDFSRNCTEFSGGWKMRILITLILLSDPDIMLLDEPTNHLDTESMEWLERYLKDYPGTILTIAHDRVFLDKIVNQIAELSNRLQGKLFLLSGGKGAAARSAQKADGPPAGGNQKDAGIH